MPLKLAGLHLQTKVSKHSENSKRWGTLDVIQTIQFVNPTTYDIDNLQNWKARFAFTDMEISAISSIY